MSTNLFDERLQVCPIAPIDGSDNHGEENETSWFARWMVEVSERWTTKARQNTDGDKLHVLLREDGQFKDIEQSAYYSPIGWEGGSVVGNVNGTMINKLMLLNILVS